MTQGSTAALLRGLSEALGPPTHLLLFASAALAVFEVGLFIGEWVSAWRARVKPDSGPAWARRARRRVDRVDSLARVGPMLGLMGTLIPLGPGLSALGRGDARELALAVTVAFDTTVLGLAVGMVGFVLGRLRRGHYDARIESAQGVDSGP